MTGFELTINNKKITAALDDGSVLIILNRVLMDNRDEIDISFVGFDKDKEEEIQWLVESLKEGDTITVEVKEVVENSKPEKVKKLGKEEDFILQAKYNTFLKLQKELEEQGYL
jgi:hypothetical protein